MIRLRSSPKIYCSQTERSKTPEDTLAFVKQLTQTAGITRVADITDLDRIKIPVYSCIRPTAADGAISVYNGKGGTEVEARVAGIMEGIERYSAEAVPHNLSLVSYAAIARVENAIDPVDLILPQRADPKMELPWMDTWDIANNCPSKVPLCAVIHPNPQYLPSLFRSSSNGIASGNTMEEAIFYALTEVIERDSWSLAEAARDTGPAITNLTGAAAKMLAKFTKAGIEVTLKDITSDIGIPTVAAVADDVLLQDPRLLTIGMGTHTNPEIAVIRALSEAAQSRATQIHGAREDATIAAFREVMGYDRVKRMNAYWFRVEKTKAFSEIAGCATPDFRTDIFAIIDQLKAAGLERVLITDLTDSELGVPVVRVIVPGLECFTIDNERRGKRCINAEHRRLHRSKPST
ncbi:MAG: YcaO-related McrA-glycine thioamidation protein [Methanocalculaceae archaeon]|jgi:ribosomal protein S12 methylthiotransferase accessory factor|nr:YcaO-related McrA-glycine thioamidation protein [Methanocalculaceae archaeon]